MADPKFANGASVKRVEARDVTEATVISSEETSNGWTYLIQYAEGGQGYWPESALTAA